MMSLYHWIRARFFQQSQSYLRDIFIAPTAGADMHPVSKINAVVGRGLQGDRYFKQCGYWDPVEGCQITLITMDEIHMTIKTSPIPLGDGQHRRNLVINGLKPKHLIDKKLRIGTAVFQYQKPRPPCGYLDKLTSNGTAEALRGYAGCCLKVIESGTIEVGDNVYLAE